MLQHHVLFPKAPHRLQDIGTHLLPLEPWKSYYREDWDYIETKEQIANMQYYNGADSLVTAKSFDIMSRVLHQQGLWNVYDTDRQITMITKDWTKNGILLDEGHRSELVETFGARVEQQLADLREMSGDPQFNPNSTKQLADVLCAKFGIVPKKRTPTGKVATNEKALFEVRHHPFVEKLLQYRGDSKLYSTYIVGECSQTGPDGRLHPVYSIPATPSGRFGTKPAIQNWPKEMSKMLIPRPGFVWIQADFKALELRIIALVSGEDDLVNMFLNGDDVHMYLARTEYFKDIWDQAPAGAHKKMRKLGKSVTFGDNYLATPPTMYETVRKEHPSITLEEVTYLQARLRNRFPRKLEWAMKMADVANKTLELRTPWLRRRRRWPFGGVKPPEAANHPIQGGAGDIVAEATIRWTEHLRNKGDYWTRVFPCLQIHDSLAAEVEESYAEQALEDLMRCMTMTKEWICELDGKKRRMHFTADGSIGPNLYEMTEREDIVVEPEAA